jgi:leader peptidase (prepilin peptidase)/N-methyltransferase
MILLWLIVFAFGLCVGSFLNVCIYRLPLRQSLVFPGSACPRCGAPVRWFDNVPLLSYVWLGGRCRACRQSISPRYPMVELITACLFGLHAVVFGLDPMLAARLCLAAMLVALFAIDLEHQLLPDAITLPGIVVGLLCSLVWPPGIVAALIGAATGGGVLFAIRWGWRRATGVDGMGLGDVKMLAMIGAFLGWQQVWLVLFVASVTGALAGIGLAVVGRGTMKSRLPFGTFLAIAAIAASLFGDDLVNWYLGFYR